jgi:hypothetical protein
MGFLDIFKRKKQGVQLTAEQWQERERIRQENRELDDARKNYDLKILVAKKEVELLAIEREKLEIQSDINEEFGVIDNEQESPEELAMKFLSVLSAKNGGAPVPNQTDPKSTVSAPPDISVSELQKTWDATPMAYKKLAQEMSDDKLKDYLLSKNPQMSSKSIGDAISIIRGVSPEPPSSEVAQAPN